MGLTNLLEVFTTGLSLLLSSRVGVQNGVGGDGDDPLLGQCFFCLEKFKHKLGL